MSLSLTFIYASSNRFVASSFRVSRNNREEKSKFRLRPREHIAAVLAVWFHTSTKPFAHFLLCVLCRAALTLTVLFIYLSSGKTSPGKTQATARASCAGRKCFYLFLWGGVKSQEARLPWSPLSDWSEATRRRGDTCSDPPSSSAIWCLTSAESWCCEIECSGWALSRSPKH